MKKYSWDEIKLHKRRRDCWLLIDGDVYDVSNFDHPGGWANLVRASRRDATDSFFDVKAHSSDRTKRELAKLKIGVIDEQDLEDDEDQELRKKEPVKLEMESPEDINVSKENQGIDSKKIIMGLFLLLIVLISLYILVVE